MGVSAAVEGEWGSSYLRKSKRKFRNEDLLESCDLLVGRRKLSFSACDTARHDNTTLWHSATCVRTSHPSSISIEACMAQSMKRCEQMVIMMINRKDTTLKDHLGQGQTADDEVQR